MQSLLRDVSLNALKNTRCANGLVLFRTQRVWSSFPGLNAMLNSLQLPLMVCSAEQETPEETFARGVKEFHRAVDECRLRRHEARCICLALSTEEDHLELQDMEEGELFSLTIHTQTNVSEQSRRGSGWTDLHIRGRESDHSGQSERQIFALIYGLLHHPLCLRQREPLFAQAAFYDAQQQLCALRMWCMLDQYLRADHQADEEHMRKDILDAVSRAVLPLPKHPGILHPPVVESGFQKVSGSFSSAGRRRSFLKRNTIDVKPDTVIRQMYGDGTRWDDLWDIDHTTAARCRDLAQSIWDQLCKSPVMGVAGNLPDLFSRVCTAAIQTVQNEYRTQADDFANAMGKTQKLHGTSVSQLNGLFTAADNILQKIVVECRKQRILEELQRIAKEDDAFWNGRETAMDTIRYARDTAYNYLAPGLERYWNRVSIPTFRFSWRVSMEELVNQCSKPGDTWTDGSLQELVSLFPNMESTTTKDIFLCLDSDLQIESPELRHNPSGTTVQMLRIGNLGAPLILLILFSKPDAWEVAQTSE